MSVVIDGTSGITTPAETVQGALTTTGNTILGDSSADTLNVGNGGLVKDASGNVGIGTASPNALLHVSNAVAKIRIGETASSAYLDISRDGATGYSIYNAAQADPYRGHVWQLGGTEAMRIDTAGLLQFNSGYGSVATAYGCRAWVNFNGTGTVAIRASGNVSSITDNGTGYYTVNFTTSIVDANYSAVLTCNESSGGSGTGTIARLTGTATTSVLPLETVNLAAARFDQAFICASVFR